VCLAGGGHQSLGREFKGTMNRGVGLLVVVAGVFLVIAGFLIYSGALNWFGRLPGDIRYEGEHTRVYVPIISMLIISIVLSLILYLIRRFL
jgi:hypothetical protein